MSLEGFEVAVVGAGPAGSAAALTLAREGVQVLLVERGTFPGSKNVFGGRIYSYALKRLLGERWKDAPVERFVRKEGITFMTADSSFSVEYESKDPTGSFTSIRSKFDKWLAEEAEKAGASLITDSRVDDLVLERGIVKGIIAGPDKIPTDVVIACDGTTTNLARKAGLASMLEPREVSIGMKDVIELPADKMEERLGLEPEEGAAHVFVGECSGGLRGGGFLYTNKDSLALGMVVGADDISTKKVPSHTLMDRLRNHRKVRRLIRGGKTIEYDAHMIPEAGPKMLTRPYTGGMLVAGDAAGHLLNNGYTFRGVDMAIVSGIAAAQTILEARKRKDYSAQSLQTYARRLREEPALKDMYTFSKVPRYLRNNRLYNVYPELVCNAAEAIYRVDGNRKRKIYKELRTQTKGKVSTISLIRDLLAGARTF
ncbi:FAD-dependent oxidoreductase [Candidatus Bathyarchaeota archaeon]|nr:MAG: FAD-dependent oxidoreductase [Candidatus Bathyarchaeota archaeon]TMI54472.1 MAG: FAD-dependent oxidoreductase [Candidatus Bathyarchaeota archaeon]TMI60321.1 MAG: FAD-dependent oxidoreductase [Candidatus Bathyarchaeota archaeon]